jgi:hypothetical protein
MQKPIVVKLSHPRTTFGYEDIGLLGQSPGSRGEWDGYTFEINNDVAECDYWVVIESVQDRQTTRVPEGNLIFVLSEPAYNHVYSAEYLSQFDRIFTWREDIRGENVARTDCVTNWWVKRTYDQLKSDVVEKTATLSVIASDRATFPGHRKRFAFINRMIGHFKDRLAVYGDLGGEKIRDKYDAIAPYEYSIAIEADQHAGYWTEKIADCYLCETMPIYFGCPNIADFVPAESFVAINIDDYKASIRAIEEAIDGNLYRQRRQKIIEVKHRILDELQVFPHIVRILRSNGNRSGEKRRVEVNPARKLQHDTPGGWKRRLLT